MYNRCTSIYIFYIFTLVNEYMPNQAEICKKIIIKYLTELTMRNFENNRFQLLKNSLERNKRRVYFLSIFSS